LSMEGAGTAGGIAERARAALAAGCDMVLLCNDPRGQEQLLEALDGAAPVEPGRFACLRARQRQDRRAEAAYLEAAQFVRGLA